MTDANIHEFLSQRQEPVGSNEADEFDSEAAGDLFSRCFAAFYDDLPQETKSSFREYESAEEMLDDLRSLLVRKRDSRLMNCFSKIESFSRNLAPYFDIINVFVQIRPDYVAGFWGSLMLVCKLGTNVTAFFERTTEMFERISAVLPQYATYLSVCLARVSTDNTRMVRSLFLVYMDIIDFCKQICTILSRGHAASIWKRAGFWGSITWKPFQVRFEQLIARMADHERIFKVELDISDGKVLSQIYHSQRKLTGLYSDLQEKLSSQLIADQRELAESQAEQQMIKIKSWMAARSDRRRIYEHSRDKRVSGSGEWFLSSEEYASWRDRLAGSHPQMLLIKAKPGFGKTYLSTVIIDDLTWRAQQCAFFHFSQNVQVYDGMEHTQAFRAIAVQLLHQSRKYPDTIDAISVLMRSSSAGYIEASDVEIEAALEILCTLHSPRLIIDGVDESNDTDKVLTTMHKLCAISNTSIMALNRPDIELPRSLKDDQTQPIIRTVTMKEANNTSDVKTFIRQEFTAIEEARLFGSISLPPDIVDSVTQRANGMFLWANLFIRYLNSRSLTPRDRLEFLYESWKFEGLDGLCNAILSKLSRRIRKEREVAADIFRWIGAAIYPLTLEALHTAIAIIPGQPNSPEDYLLNFESNLSMLSGSLAEIDMFGRAAFIHLSVREYLASARCEDFPEFSLEDVASTHSHLAIRCLSYLTHDIPREPLRYLPEHSDSIKIQDSAPQESPDMPDNNTLNDELHYDLNPMAIKAPSNLLHVDSLPMKMSIQELTEIFRGHPGFRTISLSEDGKGGIACCVKFDTAQQGAKALLKVESSYYGNAKDRIRLRFARSHHLRTDASRLSTNSSTHASSTYSAKPRYRADVPEGVDGIGDNVAEHRPPIRTDPAAVVEQPMRADGYSDAPYSRSDAKAQPYEGPRETKIHASDDNDVHGSSQTQSIHPSPDRPIYLVNVERKYPFLKYATMYWAQHVRLSSLAERKSLSRARMQNAWSPYPEQSYYPRHRSPYSFLGRGDEDHFSTFMAATAAQDELGAMESASSSAPSWIPYLSRFLLRRENFTTWVESSYCYRLPPSLREVLRIVQGLARDESKDTAARREVYWILHGLNQFAEALDELRAKHYKELRSNPTRLWGEGIRAARDPAFWPMGSKSLEPPRIELLPSCNVRGVQGLGVASTGPVQLYSDLAIGSLGMGER